MLKYLPCVTGKKFPNVKNWSTNTPYNGFVGRERLLVCGDDENRIEALDFDNGGSAFDEYWRNVPEELKGKVYVERTPSGGRHIVYRCEEVESNKKLAINKDGKVLIETRGYGGLLKVAPSVGYEHTHGPTLEELELISVSERSTLMELAQAFNEQPEAKKRTTQPTFPAVTGADETPTDYVRRNGVELVVDALVKNGWSIVRENAVKIYFSHPHASDPTDIHLSVDRNGGWVHNWSGNKAEPFSEDRTYSAYEALALLNHNGDQSELGRFIRETFLSSGAGTGAGAGADGQSVVVDFDEPAVASDYQYNMPVVERPHFDFNLDELPFILREYVQEVLSTAKAPQPAMAIFSGVVGCAYVVARRLRTTRRDGRVVMVGLPVYVMSLAESGQGKNHPLTACRSMARSYEKNCYAIMSSPRSEQVVTEAVCEFKKVLMLFDEVGDALFSDRSNSFAIGLKRALKELYNFDDLYTPPRSIAASNRLQNKLGTDCPVIHNPSAQVYATGIPTVVYKLMSDADLEEGLAGRFLICLGEDKVDSEDNPLNIMSFMLPESVRHWVETWSALGGVSDFAINVAFQEFGGTENECVEPDVLSEANTAMISLSDEAVEMLTEISKKYKELSNNDTTGMKTAYSRVQYNTQVIGQILACADGDRYDNIVVQRKHIDLALKLVEYSVACLEYLLKIKINTDDTTSKTKEDNSNYGRGLKFIQEWKPDTFHVREFNSHVGVHGAQSRHVLQSLIEESYIEKTTVPSIYLIQR